MTFHGKLDEYVAGREDWKSYTERLAQYFTANDIVSAEKRRAILISSCGAVTYRLMKDVLAPEAPTRKWDFEDRDSTSGSCPGGRAGKKHERWRTVSSIQSEPCAGKYACMPSTRKWPCWRRQHVQHIWRSSLTLDEIPQNAINEPQSMVFQSCILQQTTCIPMLSHHNYKYVGIFYSTCITKKQNDRFNGRGKHGKMKKKYLSLYACYSRFPGPANIKQGL